MSPKPDHTLATTTATGRSDDLHSFITRRHPLGPEASEPLVESTESVFRQLYDETNHIHRAAHTENPSYIVGRKGAGKTAFLVGGALAENADVVLLKSEEVWPQVNLLRLDYEAEKGPLVADSLVHVWEVLLYHAALLGIVRSTRLPNSSAKRQIWTYLRAFGPPRKMKGDHLLAEVSAAISDALAKAPRRLAFREVCWSIETSTGSFEDAAQHARQVLAAPGAACMYVVVDNLEDLHEHIDAFAPVVTALFRISSRARLGVHDEDFPFVTQFAFPAELVPQLGRLAANPEKDFTDRLEVRWRAGELLVVMGNRLRTFLDLYFPDAARQLGLPHEHDQADRDAAEVTIRSVLPSRVTNGYGTVEDPVAYILRHTQLLPRHLIQIFNEILSRAVHGLGSEAVPRASSDHVIDGVREAELNIVEGMLNSYRYRWPMIAKAMELIKNHAGVVETVSGLHRAFNNASVAKAEMDFDAFLEACLGVGALGVVNEEGSTERYIEGRFSYTFTWDIRAVEHRDSVCVHPLFMYRWFDATSIPTLAKTRNRPIYPYGSDPAHDVDFV